MTEPLGPATVRAQLTWGDLDSLPVLAANQFIVQLSATEAPNTPSDIVLTVGYLAPPLLIGTLEEQQQAAAAVDHLTVRPVARFSVPTAKAAELARLLQDVVQRVEATRRQP